MVGEPVEEERPRDVEQEPGPVAGGAAVVELPAQVERDLHQAPLRHPLPRGEKAHPARIGCVVGSAANTSIGAFHPWL